MAENSKIEWTDATWNPITGCTLVSEGCRHCYAASLAATRLKHHPSREGLARINAAREAKFTGEVRFNEQWLDQPLRWRRPRRVFVCAHGDLFHEAVPDEWIDRVFAVMALAPQHTFQVLTKRPKRAERYLEGLESSDRARHLAISARLIGATLQEVARVGWRVTALPLPNVWLGTSVEDQATADARIPHLLATPAAVRFLSAEPLLGPVDLRTFLHRVDGVAVDPLCDLCGERHEGACEANSLDWVIVGGESGTGARPMHPDRARSLRDQCQAAGVPFFFKQWGEWAPSTEEEAAGNPRSGWQCLAGRPHVARAEELYASAGAAFIERKGKACAGRLLDGRTWDEMPGGSHA